MHHCRPEASCQISTTTISRYSLCFLKRKIRWHTFLMPRTHTVFISRSQSWSTHRDALPSRRIVPFLRRTHPAAGNANSRVPSAGAVVGRSCRGLLLWKTCSFRGSLRSVVYGSWKQSSNGWFFLAVACNGLGLAPEPTSSSSFPHVYVSRVPPKKHPAAQLPSQAEFDRSHTCCVSRPVPPLAVAGCPVTWQFQITICNFSITVASAFCGSDPYSPWGAWLK